MWVVAPTNRGGTSWVPGTGGIPGRKPAWHLVKPAPYGVLNDLCMTETEIYINSAAEIVVALAADDGKKRWQTKLPNEGRFGIALDDKYVFVAPYLLDRITGEVVFSAEETALCVKRGKHSYAFVAGSSFLWEVAEPAPGLHRFYPGQGERFYPITLGDMHAWDGGTAVYGVHEGKVACLDLEGGAVRWNVELPKARNGEPMVCGHSLINIDDRVYVHVNYDTLWCIDGASGQFIWKAGPDAIEKNAQPYEARPPTTFLASRNLVYLGREHEEDGFLQCHDSTDGKQLWRIPMETARFGPIVGDLMFGSIQGVPVAWDRYTGELVWRAEKGMVATFHAVAAGNKVVYTTTTGMMRCYAWSAPYHSPAKPRS